MHFYRNRRKRLLCEIYSYTNLTKRTMTCRTTSIAGALEVPEVGRWAKKMISGHSDPLIIKLDEVLEEFTPLFESFADEHGFDFRRSQDGDFNPPVRTIQRYNLESRYFQTLDFRIGYRDPNTNRPPDPSEQLPLRLTAAVSAFCFETREWSIHRDRILDGRPLVEVRERMAEALQASLKAFADWPHERVISDGDPS